MIGESIRMEESYQPSSSAMKESLSKVSKSNKMSDNDKKN
jgi:hypothetical protein